MASKEIEFLGQLRKVPHLGGRRLTRIAAALHQLLKTGGIGSRTGIELLRARQYPLLIMMTFDQVLSQLTLGRDLTEPEELFYGTLGEMIGCTALEVSDAPLDELKALVTAIWEQEAQANTGKLLIDLLVRYGESLTANTSSPSSSASPTDTTSPTPPTTESQTPATGTP